MRFSTLPLLVAVAAGLTACTGLQQSAPQNPGWGPPPGQWNPQAQGGQWGPGGPAPWGPQGQQMPPLLPPIYRPVNVPALLAIQNLPCAPKEVAPGTWAKFDCGPFQAISQAVQYFPGMMPRFNFLPAGPSPAGVDHRVEGSEGPIKDQGAVGVCTAVSLSTAMDNAVRRMGRQDVISALHVWSNYGVPTMGEAGDRNVNHSLAIEQSWPYDPAKACKLVHAAMDTCTTAYGVSSASESFDPSLKAEHARADSSGRYRLAAIERLHAQPADPNELSAVLAGGDDVWVSFRVNDEAWMQRSLHDSVIPDYEPSGETGHAVVLAGYRTLPNGAKQFLIHNSWGPRWGEQGYGWISEAMVVRNLRCAYKVRVTDGASPAPPGAQPAPGTAPGAPPGATGCPDGQMKDPIFGTCIPGVPGLPGFPAPGGAAPPPGQLPAPGQLPMPGQQPQKSACPQGQAPDMMTGGCANLCPGGAPTVGGMCLPLGR